MRLFEDEFINITKIHTVELYSTAEVHDGVKIKRFPPKLYSYELIFFKSGRRITTFGDKVLDEDASFLRFLPKDSDADIYTVEAVEDGECIDIYFDTDSPRPSSAIGLKNMKELSSLFDKAYNVWRSRRVGYYAEAMSLFYDIIRRVKLHSENYFTDAQANKISPSHEYMLKHFAERDFDYKEAARQSGLSYDYYKELFIKKFGMSPVKYVRALRIERACELLITGQYSVSEVAEASGFDNVYYFSNVFRKHLGVSPKSYGK